METRVQQSLESLRQSCFSPGVCQLKCLSNTFRRFDADYSKHITFKEFQKGLRMYKLFYSNSLEMDLFAIFDQDRSGQIDFSEFCDIMAPPLVGRRLQVVDEVFTALDTSHTGILHPQDLPERLIEKAKQHPKYLSGEWTVRQVLEGLLVGLKKCKDNLEPSITRAEFRKYYSSISPWITDDAYFKDSLRSSWGV